MSQKGTFIIRAGGQEKSLCIPSNADPGYMAQNVISLVRECDLHKLFDCMSPSNFSEYFWFDARDLMMKTELGKSFSYKDNAGFITDSLMCEYGYVLDLDEEELDYYIGFQKKPQKGNRYGEEITYTSEKMENYYPCKLVARFSFKYVRSALLRVIVENMRKSDLDCEVKFYDVEDKTSLEVPADEPELMPSLVTIFQKLDWIKEKITTTFDKQIDMTSRYDQALIDIGDMRIEMHMYKMEIANLQYKVDALEKKCVRHE